jgi:hypothetical protein
MDLNTAAITGLKLIGYERPLTMWEPGYQPALTVSPNGNGHKKPSKKQGTRGKRQRVKTL